MKNRLLFLSLTALLLTACDSEEGTDDHGHAHGESVSMTQWTDSLEVFLEYEPPAHTGKTAFVVHLTRLSTWSPVSQGVVVLYTTGPDGKTSGGASKDPRQDGIYRIPLQFRAEGTYDLTLVYRGETFADTCRLPSIQVGHAAASGTEEDADHETDITYLKEQQWTGDFASDIVAARPVRASLSVSAEIMALPGKLTEISAPVNGTVLAREHAGIPSIGSWVARGSALAVLAPDPGNVNGLAQIRAEYLDAKSDYERVKRLHADGAVSDKRLEIARNRFDAARAGYELLQESDAWSSGNDDARLVIRAPLSGYLERIAFRPGQHITAGQPMFVIIDPTRLMLTAHVPAAHASELGSLTDAWFGVEGFDRSFRISELNGQLISQGKVVDPQTRTLRVSFAFDNPGGALSVGLFADARLETGSADEVLAVPHSAVIDEADGVHSVFVQRGGERFEQRSVTLGRIGERYVEITEGLRPGERIVIRGVQQVRLASMASSVPEHGHTH